MSTLLALISSSQTWQSNSVLVEPVLLLYLQLLILQVIPSTSLQPQPPWLSFSWTPVICLYLTDKLLWADMSLLARCDAVNNFFFYRLFVGSITAPAWKRERLVRCESNRPVIGFIWRWSLSPLVPFVYSDVDSIFHCLLLSPRKWTIIFRKLISATHIKHMRIKTAWSGTPSLSLCVTSHAHTHTPAHWALSLCASIHLGHKEILNIWFFSCLLASNPSNPLFAMLGIYSPRLNFSKNRVILVEKGPEDAADILISW